jgi:hypothetical protein
MRFQCIPQSSGQGSSPLPFRDHGRQKPELGLHVCGIGHRICDFLAQQFAIPFAKPVNRYFERFLGDVHFASQRGIRRIGMPQKEHLQPLEMLRASNEGAI